MLSSPMKSIVSESTALKDLLDRQGSLSDRSGIVGSVQRIARFANTGPAGHCMMWHLITPNTGARAQVDQPTSDTLNHKS